MVLPRMVTLSMARLSCRLVRRALSAARLVRNSWFDPLDAGLVLLQGEAGDGVEVADEEEHQHRGGHQHHRQGEQQQLGLEADATCVLTSSPPRPPRRSTWCSRRGAGWCAGARRSRPPAPPWPRSAIPSSRPMVWAEKCRQLVIISAKTWRSELTGVHVQVVQADVAQAQAAQDASTASCRCTGPCRWLCPYLPAASYTVRISRVVGVADDQVVVLAGQVQAAAGLQDAVKLLQDQLGPGEDLDGEAAEHEVELLVLQHERRGVPQAEVGVADLELLLQAGGVLDGRQRSGRSP